jgi:hypothetical protein
MFRIPTQTKDNNLNAVRITGPAGSHNYNYRSLKSVCLYEMWLTPNIFKISEKTARVGGGGMSHSKKRIISGCLSMTYHPYQLSSRLYVATAVLSGAWCWPPTPFSRRGWEWVELYLHSPSRPLVACYKVNFTLQPSYVKQGHETVSQCVCRAVLCVSPFIPISSQTSRTSVNK